MFATGETVGLAEWIIDDTCLFSILYHEEVFLGKISLGRAQTFLPKPFSRLMTLAIY